ncbi:MAG: glycosyltransferase family 39 protein [Bacillota bacterium]|nr:glycosyltransferase family 39 protein [Bacillota bacterium]
MKVLNRIKMNWDKAAIIIIMAITGFLSFYAIGNEGYSNEYYASAVKSMLTSWHNFFFASLDPGGYVTVDKPALGLWLQAISAFIFGFHGWSIILPEALSAVLSVAILFHIVKRFFGKAAGLAAASALGMTPILIAVSRTNNLDSSLVMILLLATWSLLVAAEKGSFRFLILAMTLVGIGFNIKMLEAFMVLPAFYLVYLFTSPAKVGKRILQLAGATAVLLIVSLSWSVAVDLTPAESRPYIGSSQTNSVLELALGYNGIQRVTGDQNGQKGNMPNVNGQIKASQANGNDNANSNINGNANGNVNGNGDINGNVNGNANVNGNINGNGNLPAPPNGSMPDGFNNAPNGQGGPGNGGSPGGTQENGQKGIFRIFNKNLSGQISWFIPLALFGALTLLLKALNKKTKDRKMLARYLILFASLIFPMITFFSIAGFFHRYYLSMLAPGLAALAGIGLVEMWKAYLDISWKWVLLPAAIVSNAAVQVLILLRYDNWTSTLVNLVCLLSAISATGLVIIRIIRKDNLSKTIEMFIVLAFAAFLIAPAVWAYTPIKYGSQSVLPIAGPELQGQDGMGLNEQNNRNNQNNQNEQNEQNNEQKNFDESSSSTLTNYLLSNYNGEKYLVAVADARSAASLILETGKPVMAVGGFSGSDNILTVDKLKEMVKDGQIRYFQISGRGMGQQSAINAWVEENGKIVNIENNSSTESGHFAGRMERGSLYDLSSAKA